MIILIKELKQKTEVTINGFTTEHRTSFLKKLSYSDAIEYLKSKSK